MLNPPPLAVSLWYAMTGIQQAVGGLMAFGVAHIMSGPLKSWQGASSCCASSLSANPLPPPVLFIALGGITILWGLYMLWWLPDSPMRATVSSRSGKAGTQLIPTRHQCFSEEDRKLLVERGVYLAPESDFWVANDFVQFAAT